MIDIQDRGKCYCGGKISNQEEISYSGIPGSLELTVNSAAAALARLQLSSAELAESSGAHRFHWAKFKVD